MITVRSYVCRAAAFCIAAFLLSGCETLEDALFPANNYAPYPHAGPSQVPRKPRGVPTAQRVPHAYPTPKPPQERPDNPDIAKALDAVWETYQGFEYEKVIEQANVILRRTDSSREQRALAYILEAASFYILGMTPTAQQCVQWAVELAPSVTPNPAALPSEVCRMHETLLKSRK